MIGETFMHLWVNIT